ncbi:hypothetical protein BGX20_000665 [Mortierella sp. AD010]|nr:hypothetical protein BGX20_000665 [Mortierella sp. AD010]
MANKLARPQLNRELLVLPEKYPEAPKTLDELREQVQEIWTNIPIEYLQHLYDDMPGRMELLYRNKGGVIKY